MSVGSVETNVLLGSALRIPMNPLLGGFAPPWFWLFCQASDGLAISLPAVVLFPTLYYPPMTISELLKVTFTWLSVLGSSFVEALFHPSTCRWPQKYSDQPPTPSTQLGPSDPLDRCPHTDTGSHPPRRSPSGRVA